MDRIHGPPLLLVLTLVFILIVNPLRQMSGMDDSWAYARTVQHLLATGRYQLDPWAAANMPVQVYLAAFLSKIFGYSLALMRCSTLALLLVALFSFYALLRELSCTPRTATVFTMPLLASPLVFILVFSFMSDVQFLGWLLLALWLYVRGLRRRSLPSMILGSLSAACAIGTRQFGVALLAGLILCCLVANRERRPLARLLLAGLALPLLAAAMQFHMGLAAPNITQALRLQQQHWYLHRGIALAPELFWRCALLLQYTGMAMLPVLPFALLRSRSAHSGRSLVVGLLTAAAIVAALSISSFATARPAALHQGLWEPLELWWLLPTHFENLHPIMRLLDLTGIVGGAVLAATGLRCLAHMWRSRNLSAELALLLGTAAGLFVLHLLYVQMNDPYIIPFIPFGLLAFASDNQDDRADPTRSAAPAWSIAISVTLVLALSFFIRGEDARLEAQWKAADRLVASGIPATGIVAPLAWQEYHGAFDQWIDAGAPGFLTSTSSPILPGYDRLHGSFYPWLRERDHRSAYFVFNGTQEDRFPADWQILATDHYRNAIFRKRVAWTIKRSVRP
jgi:hypothetical protein